MNHYEALGVRPAASDEELRKAYLSAARRHHPDAGGDDATMTRLNEAWSVLSDPTERRRYDAALGVQRVERTFTVDPDGDTKLPFDADYEDLLDTRPYYPPPTRHGTLSLVPPGIFVGSIAVACVALVFDSPAMLGGAAVLFFLSCVAIAAVSMWTLRSAASRRRR